MNLLNRILLFFKPFQVWLQGLGYIESDFTTEQIHNLLMVIKPGDIVGSYESGRFTSSFIKGDFDHAAIVDENLYVVEAVGDKYVNKVVNDKLTAVNIGGVRKVRLEEWLWKKNQVFVARHIDPQVAFQAALNAKKYVGRHYDYSFYWRNEDLYCSELVYVCYKSVDPNFLAHVKENQNILPIDYLHDRHLLVIYNSRLPQA